MSVANTSTVLNAIKHDYAELKEHYENILGAQDTDSKIHWQNQFTCEFAPHSLGEELVVYPATERHLDQGGKEMANKDRKENLKVKELLYKSQKLSPSDQSFELTIMSLWSELIQHVQGEVFHNLPALEKTSAEGDSQSMASSFGRTKMFGSTRSHPSALDKPPFETVAGLMAAPLDKLRDPFRQFSE
ncbi:uncharacterized protein Z519_08782 [Cladophialophora bantiana CBS 173.52]|uniref:Hemerythrin-like domain-containing protein n=1 Tax=Cladophialophora bantiana (strain ATCC 10958 / CBS 173.52 / CDC B-1940 / NIH 8579) TaxID=1442370 RepID=A0A0D2I2D5_CLAB1|nr:uncharacterized protein Z519_08782 [Cladophialophora bantiana CBS 173.52]KIW90999.1 hypothetical protein Z519_08782 [Cladophialophora bantiana CBS 173.52]